MRDDITAIKSNIDVQELFQRHFPQHFRANGNSLCPFHNDTNDSLSFRNGSFKCFADHCGVRGDVIDLYMQIHGCDFREAVKVLQAETGTISGKPRRKTATGELQSLKAQRRPEPDFVRRYGQLVKADLIPYEAIEYLTNRRCLSEELVEKLETDKVVTWLDDGYTQSIVFPVFNTANLGEMVGYQKIPIFGGDKQFAKNTRGSAAVFHYGQSGPVIVTEAILDGLSAMDCMPCSMLCIMSSSGTAKLAQHRGKDLVLFLDNDDAGRTATREAVKVLQRECRLIDWNLAPAGMKDVNDLLKAGHRDVIRKMIFEAQVPTALDPDILDDNYIEGFKFPERVELAELGCSTTLSAGIKALQDHIAVPGNKLARTPAGIGKTTLAVELAYKQAENQVVYYYLPNHRICREVAKRLREAYHADDIPLIHLMGRASNGMNESRIVCTMHTRVASVMKRGFDPGAVLCPKCDSQKNCQHALQLTRVKNEGRGLVIAPHAFIPIHLAPIDDENAPGKLAYVDENPFDVLLHPSEPCGIEDLNILRPYVTTDCVRFFDMLQQLIHTVYSDLVAKKKKIARYYTVTSPVAQWKNRLSLWDALGIAKEEAARLCDPALRQLQILPAEYLYERDVRLVTTAWLKAALSDSVAYLEIRDNGKSALVHMVREKIDPKCRIMLLDATIDYDEAKFIFDREFDTIDINVPWEGRRVHIRTGMGITKTKDIAKSNDTAQLSKALKSAASYLENSQNLYLATYKHHEQLCGRIMREILPGTTVLTGHYGAIRSSNRYEACDSAILFGTLRVPPESRLDAAAMLFPNDPDSQDRWMLHKDYEEVYQNAHRLRLIRNPGRTIIIVDREWPAYLLGEPDLVVQVKSSRTKIGRAVERALSYIAEYLELSKEKCYKIGIGSQEEEIIIRREYEGREGELILFSDANWWTALSRSIQERRPDIEATSLRSRHGKPSKVLQLRKPDFATE